MAGKSRLLDSVDPPLRRIFEIDLNALVAPYVGSALLALFVSVVLLLVLAGFQGRRIGRLQRRIDDLTRGADGRSLERVLEAHLDRVGKVSHDVDELEVRAARLEATHRRSFQQVGVVRFNPFEDTGGNQSFAVAVLDADGDGFVLSSLHGRGGTRVYAKALTRGTADAALSTEEAEALRQAREPRDRARPA